MLWAFWNLWSFINTSYLWYLLSSYSTMWWNRAWVFPSGILLPVDGALLETDAESQWSSHYSEAALWGQKRVLPKALSGHWFCQGHSLISCQFLRSVHWSLFSPEDVVSDFIIQPSQASSLVKCKCFLTLNLRSWSQRLLK